MAAFRLCRRRYLDGPQTAQKLSADQRQRHLRAPDRRVCDGLRYPISARFSPVSNPTS
ncbi:Uncharacterised protein [Vibrio cholerae]|nr:Uncharacterised protein [Vibrio cholerae]